MQVSVENSSDLERKVVVQVPEEKIAEMVQSRLQSMLKTTKVQGFRPGKVPMKVIEGRYGVQVRQEVVGQVVQSSFQDAIGQEKLKPAGTPSIDTLDDKVGEGLSYTATFEVIPEFTLQPMEKLKIEKPVCQIESSDVDKMIDNLRKQQSKPEAVERAAQSGDTVVIDFIGKIDDVAFEGGQADDFELELGGNRFIAGFEEGLIGSQPGEERDLDLTFPEDYPKEELAGQAVVFSVTVKEVKEPKLPELNDDFYKLFGISEGGETAFKTKLKENMEREALQKSKNAARDSILDALFEANDITLPKVMVESEAQRLQEQMKNNLKSQGIPSEALDKAGTDTFIEEAKKRVSLQLILSEIIQQNDMKADPAKVRTMIEEQARNYDDPSSVINWYYGDQNRLAEVESLALEDDIVEWVMVKAEVTETQMTFDEIMNNGQTA